MGDGLFCGSPIVGLSVSVSSAGWRVAVPLARLYVWLIACLWYHTVLVPLSFLPIIQYRSHWLLSLHPITFLYHPSMRTGLRDSLQALPGRCSQSHPFYNFHGFVWKWGAIFHPTVHLHCHIKLAKKQGAYPTPGKPISPWLVLEKSSLAFAAEKSLCWFFWIPIFGGQDFSRKRLDSIGGMRYTVQHIVLRKMYQNPMESHPPILETPKVHMGAHQSSIFRLWYTFIDWLVVWNHGILWLSIQLGMSSQLTNSYFSEG